MAAANLATQRTIHGIQFSKIERGRAKWTTGSGPTGILAFFATLPRGQRRAKFHGVATIKRKMTGSLPTSDLNSVDFFQ
jgi:hypothetical protein